MRKTWILYWAVMGFATGAVTATESRAGENWTDHSLTSYYQQSSLASHVTDHSPCGTAMAASGGACCGVDCGPVWVVGTEMTFLSPRLRNNANTFLWYEGGGANVEIDGRGGYEDFTYAPRIVLGRQGRDWGVLGRFWYLSDSNDYRAEGGQPELLGFGGYDRLEAYTMDLEITRQFLRMDSGRTVVSGGVRHASFESGAGLNTVAFFANNDNFEVLNAMTQSNSSMRGTGLTFGVTDTRSIGNRGWYLFSGARGSVLWGDSNAVAATSASVNDALADAVSRQQSSGETMFIGELMAGVQWERQLKCVPATAFFRLAGEVQWWTADDATAGASSSVSTIDGTIVYANAFAGDTDMTLVGFSVGTGLTW